MFASQLPERIGRLRAFLEGEDRENYVIEVHSLKSAARWVGAMDIGDRAEKLELAGKAGNWQEVTENTPDLLGRCEVLGEALGYVM